MYAAVSLQNKSIAGQWTYHQLAYCMCEVTSNYSAQCLEGMFCITNSNNKIKSYKHTHTQKYTN